jgi:hypothetical protein
VHKYPLRRVPLAGAGLVLLERTAKNQDKPIYDPLNMEGCLLIVEDDAENDPYDGVGPSNEVSMIVHRVWPRTGALQPRSTFLRWILLPLLWAVSMLA